MTSTNYENETPQAQAQAQAQAQPQRPAAPAAEAAYLGALIKSGANGVLTLDPDEFSQQRHELIYEAVVALHLNEKRVDAVTVGEGLRANGQLDIVGGQAYLEKLIVNAPDAPRDEHLHLIRRASIAHQMMQLADATAAAAQSGVGPEKALSDLLENAADLRLRLITDTALKFSTDADLDAILGKVEWLWPGYVLRGFVTALVGPQEAGKSSVALDLCQRVLQYGVWPNNAPIESSTGKKRDETKLLWIDTEMALAGFLQRLELWGVPRGRFILPEDPLRQLQLDNEADWRWIEMSIKTFRPPLVVIDSLSGGHRADEKDNDAMKVILLRLSELAQTYKCAIMAIHHLRKAREAEPDWPLSLDRIRGASAITQYCRSVLGVGTPNKLNEESRALASIKSNFAAKPRPLGYTTGEHGLAWGDAPEVPITVKAGSQAKEFLQRELASGPRLTLELEEAARRANLSWRTIDDTARQLRIKRFKEAGMGGCWFMSLPDEP